MLQSMAGGQQARMIFMDGWVDNLGFMFMIWISYLKNYEFHLLYFTDSLH